MRLVTLYDQFVVYTPPIAFKTFGRRVLFPYGRHVVGCHSNTMVLSCFCCSSKLFSLACEEGQNLCSVLIDQLTCSENPMVTLACWWKLLPVKSSVQEATLRVDVGHIQALTQNFEKRLLRLLPLSFCPSVGLSAWNN